MNGYVADEVEEHRSQHAGYDEIRAVINVYVTGTPDRESAVAEGHWVASRNADGEVIEGPSLVGVQGPDDGLDPDTWLVSHRVTTIRYY